VNYQLGPMGTSVEGDVDKVFETLKKCFQLVQGNNSRIVMSVTLDSKETQSPFPMEERVTSVLNKMSLKQIGPKI
jgi:uncharacterized protein YqgV (UPF0045/DUF77 family)